MNFFEKNWRIFALLAGVGVTRAVWKRMRSIDLQDKVVLITGGSRGLGLALADEFASKGAQLVLCARDEDELKRARMRLSEQGANVLIVPADVSDAQEAKRVVRQATERFGRVDILVNNAGVITAGPLRTLTRDDFEESMNIMFWGPFNMTTAALPQMLERKNGHIVNITSIGGKVAVPHLLPYTSAKFAATGFSEGLRAELAQEGVLVTTVAPGLMRTGSQVNAIIKGEMHREEYTLFTLLDTLPGSSISVRRAARQIVSATQQGNAELIITLPAQLMARLHGAFPGVSTNALGLLNRFLPTGEGAGTARHTGRESETPVTTSFVTELGQRASRNYNEL